MEYYGKLKKEGKIEDYEPIFLSSHGGDLNGFILLKGSAQKLAEIREDSAFLDLVVEAAYCLEGFGVVSGFAGEGITNIFSRALKLYGG